MSTMDMIHSLQKMVSGIAKANLEQRHLYTLCDFSFFVTFLTMYKLLSRLEGITYLLQKETNAIICSMDMVEECKAVHLHTRNTIDSYFEDIFAVSVDESMPRIAKHQMQRANVESDCPQQYYLRNMALPFLDHLCMELDSQFSWQRQQVKKLLFLAPIVLKQRDVPYETLTEVLELYEIDFPSPGVFKQEFIAWDVKWRNCSTDDMPENCAEALKACNEFLYPHTFVLLKLACIIRIRRFNNYMRCTMGENRLTGLALMHIHYDFDINVNDVIDIFSRKYAPRLMLQSVLEIE